MAHDTPRASSTPSSDAIARESPFKALSMEPALAPNECVGVDLDADRLGAFVWKFPSEGSNARTVNTLAATAPGTYPRKCRHCQRAWVSSYVNERRHVPQCRAETAVRATIDGTASAAATTSLGVAHRVWCEVDAALTGIQWRDDNGNRNGNDSGNDDDDSDGIDHVTSRIAFHEMAEVVLLSAPRDSFQIQTTSGRCVVFQCRREAEPHEEVASGAHTTPALDARQWTEYLHIFSRFTQQQQQALATVHEYGRDAPDQSVMVSATETHETTDELQREVLRVVAANDVDALEELLNDDELGPTVRSLVESDGSSLLVQAIKRDADQRIIRTMLRAGVDSNAKNQCGESPLLLAAASGDLELVRVLLQAPGIRVNQRCALGATALHAAANAGDVAVLRELCAHTDVVIKYVDENGWTALHYAAACTTGVEAMQFLCELAPELVDASCIQGNTALHVAAGYGCEKNVRVLLQTAANPHVPNADGHTAYHVALQNHHISCAMAVNEYMETPREAYERVAKAAYGKEDRVAPVELTHDLAALRLYSTEHDVDSVASSAWEEYYTEDQIPYYYNTVTGESTWYKPEQLTQQPHAAAERPPPASPPVDRFRSWSLDATNGAVADDDHGQKLPLCMIPLVSPLVSLDDPTAATKFDVRRKKDRERRRSKKMLRHRVADHGLVPTHDGDDNDDIQTAPPPPPLEFSLAHQRRTPVARARVRHYHVQ